MSAQILNFPVLTTSQKYLLESVRMTAARAGMDVRKVAMEFMAAGCSKESQNTICERARRHRMARLNGDSA